MWDAKAGHHTEAPKENQKEGDAVDGRKGFSPGIVLLGTAIDYMQKSGSKRRKHKNDTGKVQQVIKLITHSGQIFVFRRP